MKMKKDSALKREEKTRKKLAEQVLMVFEERGRKAFEIAKEAMLHERITCKAVHDALRYFMEETWYGVQHPALISLACEAVGGDPNEATSLGAAMVLLAGAVDIHDDIIDQSKTKGSKLTVFGKFGKDLALLTGDALLFKGLMLLHEGCKKFSTEKRQSILTLTKDAFFELGSAEANEMKFKGKFDVTPEKYMSIIGNKASITEAYAKIGAIIGNGDPKEAEALGHYGKTLGILTTIRDDFVDIFEPDELKNRVDNECLPLPLLYAFQNPKIKGEVISLLTKKKMTEKDAYAIAEMIWNMKDVQNFKKELQISVDNTLKSLEFIKKVNVYNKLTLLLLATMEDLQ